MTKPAGTVALRTLEPPDANVIAGWGTDPEFCRAADWKVDLPFADRMRAHQNLIEAPPRGLVRLGAVHAGVLIGYVDLYGEEVDRRELGFVVGGRDRWGRGLGFLAAAAGLDHGFGELGLTEVSAEALDANQRSVRILRRLGMMETGPGAEGRFLDRPTFHRRFAISATHWAAFRDH